MSSPHDCTLKLSHTGNKMVLSSLPMAAHAAITLNSITQKSNESLHFYISRYSRLHYAALDKTN